MHPVNAEFSLTVGRSQRQRFEVYKGFSVLKTEVFT